MAVQVKEIQTKVLKGLDKQINEFFEDNKITRDKLIDMKYSGVITGTMVLIIWDDGKPYKERKEHKRESAITKILKALGLKK